MVDELIDTGASITNFEVTELYKEIPNTWVLLEPIAFGKENKVTKVKILKYNTNKEVLRNHLLNQDDFNTLIYFFTGYDGTCNI